MLLSRHMRLITWNVNGLRATVANGYWDTFVAQTQADVICLQETKASPEQLPESARNLPGYTAYFASSIVKKGYSGVALYTKNKPLQVRYGMGIPEFDDEGRLIAAEFNDFWLYTVYFPNGGQGPERLDYKLRFYDAFLQDITRAASTKPVIFCGDVNTAHEEIDLARPRENQENTGFLPEERAWIDEVIEAGYTDAFRHLYPTQANAYTYWDMQTRARDRNVGWRLDYFFLSTALTQRLQNVRHWTDVYGSDHCPVSIDIKDS